MTQVESLLADEDNKQKLINRSSLKAGDYRVIGAKQDTQSQHAPKKGSQQKKSTQVHSYDPEIYDDPEFYDFVLREFVQDGISDTSGMYRIFNFCLPHVRPLGDDTTIPQAEAPATT